MTIDPAALARRVKPEKRLSQLKPRPDDALRFCTTVAGRAPFVADTCVYILYAAGELRPEAKRIVDEGNQFHCSVCTAELMIGVGNLHPQSAKWLDSRRYYFDLVTAIPDHRMLVPDAEIWVEAGLIAGTLARTQNLQKHQRKDALNDALILLTAARHGLPVLTENRTDFDFIQQIAARGDFILV